MFLYSLPNQSNITATASLPVDETVLPTTQDRELVTFVDETQHWQASTISQGDPTFGVCDSDDASLDNFFRRPVKINSFSWAIGTSVDVTIDPWTLYLSNPRVVNRITNFKMLRGKLHVKFVVNGNKFYYGQILTSYTPLKASDTITKARVTVFSDLVEASQRPHVFLQPTCSMGSEMILPFVWQHNALDIPSGAWAGSAMGELWFRTLNLLAHANNGTEPITVTTFAWMEDVVLSIPTSVDASGLVPQSGELDEYSGPVSAPLNTIARLSSLAQNIPVLSPYAKASQLITSRLAEVARLFGFSRPVILDSIKPYRPTYCGNVANTNLPDSSTKLTFDVKQEVCIDSRVCGLSGVDEMNLMNIFQRESYLTTFNYDYLSPVDTFLFSSAVTPMLYTTDVDPLNPTRTEWHMSPVAYACVPFRFWRGSLRFRFQIIASDFHKGRLRFSYDPSSTGTSATEYNVNYSKIVDIAECKDFTIEVGWGQVQPYLQVSTTTSVLPYVIGSGAKASLAGFENGILSVSVVNELTAPSAINPSISINVFVSAGSDFEVMSPQDTGVLSYSFAPEPAPVVLQSGELDGCGEPTKNPTYSFCQPLSLQDHNAEVFHGDPVTSVRQLLKRYNFSSVLRVPLGIAVNRWVLSTFPLSRGYVSGALYANTSHATNFNFAEMTMMNYFTACYVCRRGGIRWKYIWNSTGVGGVGTHTTLSAMGWCQRAPYTSIWANVNQAINDGSDAHMAYSAAINPMHDGAQFTVLNENPVIEIELPYQRNDRFLPGRELNYTTSSDMDYHIAGTHGSVPAPIALLRLCAAAEDFDLSYFLSTPVLYIVSTPLPA